MPRILTLGSVIIPRPVIDEATGKPLRTKVTHRGREILADAYENEHVLAGKVIDVDKATADELIKRGAARSYDPVIDGAVVSDDDLGV
jgi:hypothetical protein